MSHLQIRIPVWWHPTAPTRLMDAQISEQPSSLVACGKDGDADRVHREGAARDGDSPASSVEGITPSRARALATAGARAPWAGC
jgi:hypothetical protein